MIIPISKDIVEPIITTNIEYVDSLEEFEKIELGLNQKVLRFDNYRNCFYIKGRDARGEYSRTTIYFYETFVEKVRNIEREEFIKKCIRTRWSFSARWYIPLTSRCKERLRPPLRVRELSFHSRGS